MRIIDYLLLKIKDLARTLGERGVFTAITIILVAFASFGLGRLSKIEELKMPVRIIQNASFEQKAATISSIKVDSGFVASKNGKKYFLPWCSGASAISPQNLITFSTEKEARNAGYTPAANCPGLSS
ncbi:MAG: hypothetical protein WC724_01415 [Candidatus Paceibacterota bacterium]|jgi:hypothetical protein